MFSRLCGGNGVFGLDARLNRKFYIIVVVLVNNSDRFLFSISSRILAETPTLINLLSSLEYS